MSAPQETELRRRVRELGRREAASAPSFVEVVRARRPATGSRPRLPTAARWRPLAPVALGVALLLAVLAWRWPAAPGNSHSATRERATLATAPSWEVPTDGLLVDAAADGDRAEVEALSHEIEALLRP